MPSMSHEDFLITVREKVMDGGVMVTAASRETSLHFIHEVTFTDIIYQFIHERRDLERGDFIEIPLHTPPELIGNWMLTDFKKGHDWMVE